MGVIAAQIIHQQISLSIGNLLRYHVTSKNSMTSELESCYLALLRSCQLKFGSASLVDKVLEKFKCILCLWLENCIVMRSQGVWLLQLYNFSVFFSLMCSLIDVNGLDCC